ncbi:hypothetical protein [Azospirillum thermophilum]|uniref:Uncharacterized protein n=1 Tax=Azospirillum thermophilum TaxID=2202148 RepID=A0A2S2CR15_9PROT|nr:hypothetical protein [Azospirillum thermophilum]AWK86928.1 hypothetical protein DEW08_12430 [Azospirillum thermophilum]
MSCKRAARVATALLGVSVLALTAGGRAEASWWWRPAADEADITLVSGGRSVQPALPAEEPSLLDSAQALLGQAADAGVSAAGAAASALAEVPGLLAVPVGAVGSRARSAADTIGQFAWEVAYALGTNSTPVTAIPITEPYDPPEPAAAGTRTVLRSERRDPPPAQKPVRPQPKRPELATTAAGPLALSAAAVETAQGGASAGGLPPIQIAALPSGSDAGAMQSDAADPPVSRPLASAAKAAKPPAPAAEPAAEEEGPIDPKLLANFVYDRAQRRPDGSYFVPKPLQRLFELRTQAVEQGRRRCR